MKYSSFVDKRLDNQPYAQAGIRFHGDGSIVLISYTTPVCIIDKDKWLTCTGLYSQTTRKHISSFLKECAPKLSYYEAKHCYENNCKINIDTGEIKPL